jgi:hypothetical protein
VATVARSVSRRASRSPTFVFSALIWSNIVGVVVGMVAFNGFRSIGMINLAGVSDCGFCGQHGRADHTLVSRIRWHLFLASDSRVGPAAR